MPQSEALGRHEERLRAGDGNPVAFVTQSSKSSYKAVIVSPEQAFRIMMELGEPYRTLVFLVAVTGLRISEALGLKWHDLDYERQMIHRRRVWVGNELVARLKTDGSEAPVPFGELLADALQSWHRDTLYAKPDDCVFPSTRMKGRTPLSASMMAKDKIRPAAIKLAASGLSGIVLSRSSRPGRLRAHTCHAQISHNHRESAHIS